MALPLHSPQTLKNIGALRWLAMHAKQEWCMAREASTSQPSCTASPAAHLIQYGRLWSYGSSSRSMPCMQHYIRTMALNVYSLHTAYSLELFSSFRDSNICTQYYTQAMHKPGGRKVCRRRQI